MARIPLMFVAVVLLVGACSGRTSNDPAAAPSPDTGSDSMPATAVPTTVTTVATTGSEFTPDPPAPGTTVCDRFTSVTALGTVGAASLTESSGIVASRAHPGVYWLHNDSGGDAAVHAIDTTGAELGTWVLDGVNALDWEDIAIGPGPDDGTDYLYVGDIGDNLAFRPDVTVHRFAEPDPATSGTVTDAVPLRFGYPIAPVDSEAMFVDPVTGDLFIITKVDTGNSIVLRADGTTLGSDPILPTFEVATLDLGPGGFVSAADISPDGTAIALRGYEEVWMWARTDRDVAAAFNAEPCMAPSPEEVQGEAIAFTADGTAYVTVSEGSGPTLWRVGPG
jgi:hypothetical protein